MNTRHNLTLSLWNKRNPKSTNYIEDIEASLMSLLILFLTYHRWENPKMGNSISLVCCPYELVRDRGDVLVIKEDGESLRFKDGIFVKDILFAYPYHKIIRCCSERTVIPKENQLSCNWLYFLLPVGLALSEAAYRSLIRSAASQNLNANITTMIKIEENNQQRKENDHKGKGPAYKDCSSTYKWKPILRTIPEIASPSI